MMIYDLASIAMTHASVLVCEGDKGQVIVWWWQMQYGKEGITI